MKLSELLAQAKEKGLDFNADDLVDDTSGMSLKDARAKINELMEAAKSIESLKQQITERDSQLNQYAEANAQYRNTLDATRANLNGNANAPTIDRSWQQDPLFASLVPYLAHMEKALVTAASALAEMHSSYTNDKKWIVEHLNKSEIRRMKQDFKDFDEDKIREHAKKKNLVNRSWDDSYKDWKSDQLPNEIEAARKDEREKTIKELESKSKEPPPTEMGSHTPAPPVGDGGGDNGKGKDYNKAWGGLVDEIKGLGFGA